MAIDLTAYATPADYRSRNDRSSTADDSLLGSYLLAVSRVVDRRMGVAPGMFKPQTALTFTFSAVGGTRLRLRDERGWQYLLRSITADSLKIDSDADGAFDDYLFDTADAWVSLFPVNAAALSEPYTAVDLLPLVSSATVTAWPDCANCVQIVGNWGWETTPGAVKERVVGITRELVEMHVSGGAGVLQDIDSAIQMNGNARSLMYLLEQEFSHRIPSFG